MVSIILTILKVIGIILLCLIGLLLLCVGTVLFCPIRYRIRGKRSEEGEAYAVADVTWILRIIQFHGYYRQGKDFEYSLKVLFFRLFPKKETTVSEGERKQKDKKSQEEVTDDRQDENKEGKKSVDQNNQGKCEERTSQTEEEPQKPEAEKTSDIEENRKQKEQEKRKKQKSSNREKKSQEKNIFSKIKDKIEHIKDTFHKACDKMKDALSSYEKFREFIAEQETKEALKFLNKQRKYLTRHLKPDRFQIKMNYGMEDPASTGEILAVYSVIYPFLPGKWNVEPDFEQACLYGEINVKGKIRLFRLTIVGWRCYKNKTIRKFIFKGK